MINGETMALKSPRGPKKKFTHRMPINLDEKMLYGIDRVRGAMSRSKWVRIVIEQALRDDNGEMSYGRRARRS